MREYSHLFILLEMGNVVGFTCSGQPLAKIVLKQGFFLPVVTVTAQLLLRCEEELRQQIKD